MFHWTSFVTAAFRLGSTVYSFFLNYINLFAIAGYTCFIGVRPLSYRYALQIENIVANASKTNGTLPNNTIIVGHGSGGLAAKYISIMENYESVAFQSPKISTSILGTMAVHMNSLRFDEYQLRIRMRTTVQIVQKQLLLNQRTQLAPFLYNKVNYCIRNGIGIFRFFQICDINATYEARVFCNRAQSEVSVV